MSFSMRIKEEISKIETAKPEQIAELSAIIRNSGIISNNIKITIENNSVARRIFKLIKYIYDITPIITVRRKSGLNKNLIYILNINKKVNTILTDLSLIDKKENKLDIPQEYLIDDNETTRAYLRGLFMTTGSVNDPKTSRYHLELIVDKEDYAKFINKILNNYNLNSKTIRREKNYMIYIKEAEKISDFLRIIKAYNAVMYYEDIRIYRDHKNMTNRLNNCEQANIDKIFLTAAKQIKDIEKLQELDMIDLLDEKLKQVINYRLKYKESSLQELANIMTNDLGKKISKSGLNHRFRKIKEILSRIENK